jgi:hypothetical protein
MTVIAHMFTVMLFAALLQSSFAEKPPVPGALMDGFGRAQMDNAMKPNDDRQYSMYWNQWGNGQWSIVDSACHAVCQEGAYYRFATNCDYPFKYVLLRIKGDANALNEKIYIRLGVAEVGDIEDSIKTPEDTTIKVKRVDKTLAEMVDPDSQAVPQLTSEYQILVIDMEKSGFAFGGGSNSFQIGTWQAMTFDIDYIFMTDWDPAHPEVPVRPASHATAAGQPASVRVAGNALQIHTGEALSTSTLMLYDLQGRLARSFALEGRQNTIALKQANLGCSSYLYTLTGAAGAIVAKGVISLQ